MSKEQAGPRDQRIRDPVHNLIKFSCGSDRDCGDRVLWKLLQTPPLQRLRRIKQLGFSDFVFPGATHTRFSHALGAMQMARRMLNVLERNKRISINDDHQVLRLATLCAALLHDVGHGPYSHVFETLSEEIGRRKKHEDITYEIIGDGVIADVLLEHSRELLDLTSEFFGSEPGHSPYSRIVSSQLDCDRLDFLTRDRYYTGVKFGKLDLEWLFDSLTVQETELDPGTGVKKHNFVISSKGLDAIRGYIASYSDLYENIYFHKTTRGVERMMLDILSAVFLDNKYLDKIDDKNAVKSYFFASKDFDLDAYIKLDDGDIFSLIKDISVGEFGTVTELARRYLSRDLYKCFEVPKRRNEPVDRLQIQQFEQIMSEQSLSSKRDVVPRKGYKEYIDLNQDDELERLDNIFVEQPGSRTPKTLGVVMREVFEFSGKSPCRYYFGGGEDRDKARELWKTI